MEDNNGLGKDASFQEALRLLSVSKRLMILTGAGISVESGIPDFRSASGLWERYDPLEYASAWGFASNPSGCWKLFFELGDLITQTVPNPAHRAVAALEERSEAALVVTQNIDGLHQAAGSRCVLEFHGTLRSLTCPKCGTVTQAEGVVSLREGSGEIASQDRPPPMCACGAILKPDVVLFGDPIPHGVYEQSLDFLRSADVVMVIGTSATVAPFSQLPMVAIAEGIPLIEVNLEETGLTKQSTISLQGAAGEVLPALVNALEFRDPETLEERL